MKKLLLVLVSTTLIMAHANLFDENWQCTAKFKKQLELVGLQPASWHVKDVALLLQKIYFQPNYDFYRDGGVSQNPQPYEVLKEYLDLEYQDYKDIFPDKPGQIDVIFQGGVKPTLKKRFKALQELKKRGFEIGIVHMITVSDENAQFFKKMLKKEKYQEWNTFTFNIFIPTQKINIFAEGLKNLKKNNALASRYVIVTDATFASKAEGIALEHLNTSHTYIGAAVKAITDWKEDMKLYGYLKKANEQEATVRFAESNLHIKTREAYNAWQRYLKTQENS